jgi:hypothetical protein
MPPRPDGSSGMHQFRALSPASIGPDVACPALADSRGPSGPCRLGFPVAGTPRPWSRAIHCRALRCCWCPSSCGTRDMASRALSMCASPASAHRAAEAIRAGGLSAGDRHRQGHAPDHGQRGGWPPISITSASPAAPGDSPVRPEPHAQGVHGARAVPRPDTRTRSSPHATDSCARRWLECPSH